MSVGSTAFRSAGKFYYEVTLDSYGAGQPSMRIGIILSTGLPTEPAGDHNISIVLANVSTPIFANGGNSGYGLGTAVTGNIYGISVDLNARLFWMRKNNGLWNGNATADPATGVNGISIASGTWAPYLHFGGSGGVATDQYTGNFGQAAYSGTMPSGFTNWT